MTEIVVVMFAAGLAAYVRPGAGQDGHADPAARYAMMLCLILPIVLQNHVPRCLE